MRVDTAQLLVICSVRSLAPRRGRGKWLREHNRLQIRGICHTSGVRRGGTAQNSEKKCQNTCQIRKVPGWISWGIVPRLGFALRPEDCEFSTAVLSNGSNRPLPCSGGRSNVWTARPRADGVVRNRECPNKRQHAVGLLFFSFLLVSDRLKGFSISQPAQSPGARAEGREIRDGVEIPLGWLHCGGRELAIHASFRLMFFPRPSNSRS